MCTPSESSEHVLDRFAYPLVHLPGWVALYTLERQNGAVRLVWDGLAPASRIPPDYFLEPPPR